MNGRKQKAEGGGALAAAEGKPVQGRLARLRVTAKRAPEFVDITDKVCNFVRKSGLAFGCVVVYSRHTTAAIKINENEPLLLKDMEAFLDRIASPNGHYHHNDFTIRTVNMTEDECPNGHSHCQHLVLGASEVVPVVNGEVQLGRWQRIFMVELDRPRPREVLVQVLG